ncbi:TetR/AcrR family transcriptional regulator [Streptomyces boluensis]|uniref:TetR family transcriptional regulator n=1 Tax=Streptomyces boluensis TaxID=1775135 RepID=A0A964XNX6_9ACTN|nr:TetR/AcrR family transcriptional regulator [Streptomyces boluensis]NBE54038.1 TetR family transcriptional regulator [Streptomyces boluensis]
MSQERSVRTRRLLLHAAAEEFAARGYSGARLKTVVDRIGMTKGALYGHFASKEDLAEAVADEAASCWADLRAKRAVQVLDPVDPVGELRLLAEELALLMDEDTVFRAAVRLASDGLYGSLERDLVSTVSAHVTELVRRAQREAGLAVAFPPAAFADLVTTAIFAGAKSGAPPGTAPGIGSRTRLNGLWELLGPGG